MAKNRKVPRYVREAQRVSADLTRQARNNSWSPPTYYEDLPFHCVDCGSKEVWSAAQQKWWYEEAGGTIYSRAIRCAACRRKFREQHQGTPRRSHRDRKSGKSTTTKNLESARRESGTSSRRGRVNPGE